MCILHSPLEWSYLKSHIQGEASGEHADRESAFHPQSVYNMPKGMVQEDSSWHQQAV